MDLKRLIGGQYLSDLNRCDMLIDLAITYIEGGELNGKKTVDKKN